jgi:hypothetical protein
MEDWDGVFRTAAPDGTMTEYMRVLSCIAFLLFALADFAHADTLTVTLTTPSGLCATGCTLTFSAAASAKPNTLETNIVTMFQQPCNTSINGTCTAARRLTRATP